MSDHTRGPWRRRGKSTTVYGPPEPGYAEGRPVAVCGTYTGRPREEQLANALLVAAAPSLLEACQAVLDGSNWDEDGKLDLKCFDQMKTSVAKAAGIGAV